jgi:hypothetical protein
MYGTSIEKSTVARKGNRLQITLCCMWSDLFLEPRRCIVRHLKNYGEAIMRALCTATTLLGIATLLGCGEVYHVGVHHPDDPQGIIFYANTGACTQQTVYATPYVIVTLKASTASGTALTDSVKLSNKGRKSDDFLTLLDDLDKTKPDLGTIQNDWKPLKERQSFDPNTSNDGEFMLENSSKAATVVDYAHPYSLNQTRPWAGSTTSDYKLNADGTLSEAQGQVQDDTLSTILSALPLADLIKDAAGITSKAGAAAGVTPEPVHFSLDQEERARTRTLSRMTDYKPNCKVEGVIKLDATDAAIVVADVGAKDAANKGGNDKSDTNSSIGISGTISLPKGMLQQQSSPKQDASTDTAGQKATTKDSSKDKKTDSGATKKDAAKDTKSDSGKKPAKKG